MSTVRGTISPPLLAKLFHEFPPSFSESVTARGQ
jgi:hypothetical protein